MQLTEQIYQALFQAVLTGEFQPGQRFLTEQEAMERFQASRITIRRAFARLEESHIISRKPKVGGIVNSTFAAAAGALQTVGMLVPLDDPFARSFLHTFCREAARRDVITALEPAATGTEQNRAVMRLVLHGVRDLVVWGIDRELDFNLFLRLRILGVNLVFFDRIHPGKIADYVGLDNEAAVRLLIRRAAAEKIRHIFFADPCALDIDTSRERREFCRKACAAHQIDFTEGVPEPLPPGSAIFAVNDPAALRYLHCGVPLFSIDGTPEAQAAGIVSCRQPMEKLAKACFQALRNQRKQGETWVAHDHRIAPEEPKG